MTGTSQPTSQEHQPLATPLGDAGEQALPIRLHFTTNWGVSTGMSSRGISNSTVETDAQGFPIVRATTLTGILREQAELVAQSLDAGLPTVSESGKAHGSWQAFVEGLFGARGQVGEANAIQPDMSEGTTARLIAFTDATISNDANGESTADTNSEIRAAISSKTSVVGIQIDPKTGTVKNDFFRIIERAKATDLHARVIFLDADHAGNQLEWNEEQRKAVRFILSLAATLVRGIGSDRSVGDGQCAVLIGADAARTVDASDTTETLKAWCIEQMNIYCPLNGGRRVSIFPPALPVVSEELTQAPRLAASASPVTRSQVPAAAESEAGGAWGAVDLTLELKSPLVSYDVPMSNEVRTLDFIRGTVLLPWVHRRLRAALPGNEIVRDAVVNGDLAVTDATLLGHAVPDDTPHTAGCEHKSGLVASLPVPMCLSRRKDLGDAATQLRNRLVAVSSTDTDGKEETHVPLRGGFLCTNDTVDKAPVVLLRPQTMGRQSSAHNAATGATANGQLFLVRALAAGQCFGARVTLSARLRSALDGVDLVQVLSGAARLGSRKLTGTFGKVACSAVAMRDLPALPAYWGDDGPWDKAGETTLWFTSDLLVRSETLGHGGSIADIEQALEARGAKVRLVTPEVGGTKPSDSDTPEHSNTNSTPRPDTSVEPCGDGCPETQKYSESPFTAVVRHRRVDSWSGGGTGVDGQPRPTRMAVQAGSVMRVTLADEADRHAVTLALADIALTGLGELCPQGYGRVLVGHRLLREASIDVVVASRANAGEDEEEGAQER